MTFVHAIILGIIEGVTEFLPISSTGHLVLASTVLGIPNTEFLKSFEVMIQLGAILAVVYLYRDVFLRNWEVLKKVGVAFVPTGLIGLALYQTIKRYLLGNNYVVVGALFLGGVILIAFEEWHKGREPRLHGIVELDYKDSAWIGVAQSVALIPGVSRSAATAVGGMLLGLDRKTAVEFSFLLAVPTLAAATGLDLLKSGFSFSSHELALLAVGFGTTFLVALGAVRFLLDHVKEKTLVSFGVYRMVLAVLFFIFVLK